MQDLTICPACKIWKESLRVLPCCKYKFCEDCLWRTGGCLKCHNKLEGDISLLRIYKPIDTLLRECLASCRYCGESHSTFMLKSHEDSCPKTPVSELVKEMTDELPSHVPKSQLTEQDLQDFYIQKNLLHSFNQMVCKYSSVSGDEGFVHHVISDTDTLSGIALRYGVSVNDLRKANRLVGNGDLDLYKLLVLRIPVREIPVHAQGVSGGLDMAAYNLLKRRTKQDLPGNLVVTIWTRQNIQTFHFDFDKALAEFNSDVKVALPIPPATISETHVQPPHASHKSQSTKPSRRCCFA